MSKIVKVKSRIVITYPGGGTRVQRSFPSEYVDTKIEVIAHEYIGDLAGVVARGDGFDYSIGIVADNDLELFTASKDINEITELEATTLGNLWRPQVDNIIDVNKVLNIFEKIKISQVLTKEEEDAINPDNAEIGINKSDSFTDILLTAKTKME